MEDKFKKYKTAKICAHMIVLNEEDYIEDILNSIYKWVDQIVIVEGAVQRFLDMGLANADGTSIDNTSKILDAYKLGKDPDNKITLVRGIFENRCIQRNECLKYANKDTEWLLLVDGDEVYREAGMIAIHQGCQKHKNTSVMALSYPHLHFIGFDRLRWSAPKDSAKFMERLVRYKPGYTYGVKDTGQSIKLNGRNVWEKKVVINKSKDNEPRVFHYAKCKDWETMIRNMAYYWMREKKKNMIDAERMAVKDFTWMINGADPWDVKDHPGCIKMSQKYKLFLAKRDLR